MEHAAPTGKLELIKMGSAKTMIANAWTAEVLKSFDGGEDEAQVIGQPDSLTAPGASFFHHQNSAIGVLIQASNASVFADNAALVAAKIVSGAHDLPTGFNPLMPISADAGPFLRKFQLISPALIEMILIRLADNLTTYLTEIVIECLKSQPGLLKSSKDQMSTELILSYATIEELRSAIIERKVIAIAYLGLEKQLSWMSEHLGAPNATQQEFFPTLLEMIETRNCMVHSRAKIGSKYMKSLTAYGVVSELGQVLQPSLDEVVVAAKAAADLVTLLDGFLIPKFKLSVASVVPPQDARQ